MLSSCDDERAVSLLRTAILGVGTDGVAAGIDAGASAGGAGGATGGGVLLSLLSALSRSRVARATASSNAFSEIVGCATEAGVSMGSGRIGAGTFRSAGTETGASRSGCDSRAWITAAKAYVMRPALRAVAPAIIWVQPRSNCTISRPFMMAKPPAMTKIRAKLTRTRFEYINGPISKGRTSGPM